MRVGYPVPDCAGTTAALVMPDIPEWWGSQHSERMGNTTSSLFASVTGPQRGFAVLDRQQRRLHDRAHTLGFADLDSCLVARCQDDASLVQLAGELHTTIDVIRRLIDQAGIQRSSPKVRSGRQRRLATDRRLTERRRSLALPACRPTWPTAWPGRGGRLSWSPVSLASTGTALLQLLGSGSSGHTVAMRPRRLRPAPIDHTAFAGFCFPSEVIVLAVRWYLRFALSHRDVEELLAERGIQATTRPSTAGPSASRHRWPTLPDAARPCRHAVGTCWQVDET
jgi:hypothetical protein